MTDDVKLTITPKLRFPEFRDSPEWAEKPLDAYLDYEQPTPYLVSDTNYSQSFKTPVLTAGKTFILGYTDEQHGIYSENLPVIIFDDFTTATQFVDFTFKAKSSAMKILRAKGDSSIKFMYERLQTLSYEVGAHERHWISQFAPMLVSVPEPAEQQKIAECLSTLDELIVATSQKLDALKVHKKGLMQQLFPREGETLPRLRFPEFQDAPEWTVKKIGDFSDVAAAGDLDGALFSEVKTDEHQYPVFSNAVTSEGLYGYYSSPRYPKVSVTITARGTLGVAFLRPHQFMGIGRLVVLSSFVGADPAFVRYCWNQLAEIPREVTSIPQLTAITVRATALPFPQLEEQQRIASCLSSIDDLIFTQSDKLEDLKTQKKGLMQQLFPSPAAGGA